MTKHLILIYIIFIIFILNLTIFLLNFLIHPIIIICLIILYTLLIFSNISIWKDNYIYSIILFLIIIRGLFIIFLYFSSLISNEFIIKPINFISYNFIVLLSIYFIYNILTNPIKNSVFFSYFTESNPINIIFKKSFYNIIQIYNYPFNNITILCILLLLLNLLNIIKLCSPKSSPIRKINNYEQKLYSKMI